MEEYEQLDLFKSIDEHQEDRQFDPYDPCYNCKLLSCSKCPCTEGD